MSARFVALLERARVEGVERHDIHVTRSGRLGILLARPNGSGGAAEAGTHAEAFRYIAILRGELDGGKPLVRGPAADVGSERV